MALVVLAVAALLAGGCITDPVTGETKIGAPISEDQERGMGLEYRPMIVQEFDGAYPDAAVQRHLGDIVLGMASRSARPELPWSFTVLNTSVPNAFAVPGGQVFVTRGLLVRLEDEAEFAMVMGHEIGHVEHRHSVQQQGWQLITAGAVAVVDSYGGEGWSQTTGTLAQLGLLKFSRDDETESDVRGVENSYAAGYDPREGADVFRTFLQLKAEQGGSDQPDWLSSHPADEDRIANVQALAEKKDPRLAGRGAVPGLRVTTPAWGPLVARVRTAQKTYDRYDAALASIAAANGSKSSINAALPELRRCATELPGHALLTATVGKALLAAGDTAGARRELARAASMDQGLAEPEYLLGALALDAKDWSTAANHADRGLAILPNDYRSLWVRGEANWNRGRREEAEADFRAVLEVAPEGSRQQTSAAARLGATPAPAEKAAPARKKRAR